MSDTTVILGGQSYPIAPLTIGQLRSAGPSLFRLGIDTPEGMGAYATAIYAGLQAGGYQGSFAEFEKIPASLTELIAAGNAVGILTGYLKPRAADKDSAAGEAQPAATPA